METSFLGIVRFVTVLHFLPSLNQLSQPLMFHSGGLQSFFPLLLAGSVAVRSDAGSVDLVQTWGEVSPCWGFTKPGLRKWLQLYSQNKLEYCYWKNKIKLHNKTLKELNWKRILIKLVQNLLFMRNVTAIWSFKFCSFIILYFIFCTNFQCFNMWWNKISFYLKCSSDQVRSFVSHCLATLYMPYMRVELKSKWYDYRCNWNLILSEGSRI